jgi:predicted AAA+ superfamily ATPase
MKELLKAVCLRLSGKGGEVSSIIRLGTQYGGGKTHSRYEGRPES